MQKQRQVSNNKRIAEIDKEVIELYQKIEDIREEDRSEQAQSIMDKLMREFKSGASWLNKMKKSAVAKQMVYSPFGRIRHLYATLIQHQKVQAQQVRRGVNAPIQGMASEQGTVTNRQIDRAVALEKPVIESILDMDIDPIDVSRLVHDASYFMVDYHMVIPLYHIALHEATYGSAQYFFKNLGFKFTIEPEVEFELAARDDASEKLDFSLPNFVAVVEKVVKDAEAHGLLEGTVEDVMWTIFLPWTNAKCRRYLQKQYPLLGVHSDATERTIIQELRKKYGDDVEPFLVSKAPWYQPFNDKAKK